MAVEAVLMLQEKINDEDDTTISIQLLVPSKVIGCIIGKGGSIINEIRKRTRADVRISKGEKPKMADANDEFIEVWLLFSLLDILFILIYTFICLCFVSLLILIIVILDLGGW